MRSPLSDLFGKLCFFMGVPALIAGMFGSIWIPIWVAVGLFCILLFFNRLDDAVVEVRRTQEQQRKRRET